MGTASRTSSASRSRSPRDLNGGIPQNHPELFRSQAGTMATAFTSQNTQHQLTGSNDGAVSSPHSENNEGGIVLSPHSDTVQQPSLNDLRSVAADIKNTLTAAITDLRIDIQAITGRVMAVEKITASHSTELRKNHLLIDTHTRQLRDMNRHLEDLDNRSRRHNLRLRGLTESVDTEHLQSEVIGIFNNVLNRPKDTPITMERIHRALRPKGKDLDPPRDVICCIVDYQLKEEILRRARTMTPLLYHGKEFRIFQDLSSITLQRRRELKPLLEILRTKGIIYRWKFPFGLAASVHGRSALLRVPEDLKLLFLRHIGYPAPRDTRLVCRIPSFTSILTSPQE